MTKDPLDFVDNFDDNNYTDWLQRQINSFYRKKDGNKRKKLYLQYCFPHHADGWGRIKGHLNRY